VTPVVRIGLFEFALALSVVGALNLVIFNLFRLLGMADVNIPYYWLIPSTYFFPAVVGLTGDIIMSILCGVIALISSQKIHSLAGAIVLVVVGILAGGVGGTLVLLGGILGVIGKLT